MISIDKILSLSVATIKSTMPDAIYSGFVVKTNKVFDRNTNTTSNTLTKTPVEIINDTLTDSELQSSGILVSDLKVYLIGDKDIDIDFYDSIEYEGKIFKIFKNVETIVGSKTAIWTIICRK